MSTVAIATQVASGELDSDTRIDTKSPSSNNPAEKTAISGAITDTNLPGVPTGTPESVIAAEVKETEAKGKASGTANGKIEGGAHAVIDAALEHAPEQIKQELASKIMSNLTGAFAAADSAIQAASSNYSEGGDRGVATDAPKVAGQALNAIIETIWHDPLIPVDRKMETIFKLMAEILLEAQRTDAKLKDLTDDSSMNFQDLTFRFSDYQKAA